MVPVWRKIHRLTVEVIVCRLTVFYSVDILIDGSVRIHREHDSCIKRSAAELVTGR